MPTILHHPPDQKPIQNENKNWLMKSLSLGTAGVWAAWTVGQLAAPAPGTYSSGNRDPNAKQLNFSELLVQRGYLPLYLPGGIPVSRLCPRLSSASQDQLFSTFQ